MGQVRKLLGKKIHVNLPVMHKHAKYNRYMV